LKHEIPDVLSSHGRHVKITQVKLNKVIMVQEDMDEKTLFKSKDITALIDQVQVKHQLHIKLGPAEQINQAIEEARENRQFNNIFSWEIW
jgi:TATA-binding protein-associated factor Taf7